MRIGIDLGGTKIEAVAIEASGLELNRWRVATPRGDYPATLQAIADLVQLVEAEVGPGSVGVGIPGAISPATGLVKNANSVWLIGHPLATDLATILRRDVRVTNDANCFALSETMDGAAAGAEIAFGVIVGTGTGGGIVVRGQVLTGANAIAGEWGHNQLPWQDDDERPGPKCYCGRCGCIETFLSGPGLERDHELTTGQRASVPELVERARQGDLNAEATLQRYERRMAKALASVINVVDPDVIVLGGGLSNLERLYDAVPRIWGQYVFSDHVGTRLLAPRHGDSSGVRGAAWLWEDGEGQPRP